jgi:hypothetical protein
MTLSKLTPGVKIGSGQVEALNALLTSSGRDFLCDTLLPQSCATVLFLGRFQGEVVVWDMEVATLEYYRQLELKRNSSEIDKYDELPFIEIKEGLDGRFPLRVGLALAEIDEPVIKKTIIMLRNYKRLIIGRINFGVV